MEELAIGLSKEGAGLASVGVVEAGVEAAVGAGVEAGMEAGVEVGSATLSGGRRGRPPSPMAVEEEEGKCSMRPIGAWRDLRQPTSRAPHRFVHLETASTVAALGFAAEGTLVGGGEAGMGVVPDTVLTSAGGGPWDKHAPLGADARRIYAARDPVWA